MNIGERAMTLAHSKPREAVIADASAALDTIQHLPASELVPGETVARIIAAALVQTVVNGAPRVITRTLDDGVRLKDGIG